MADHEFKLLFNSPQVRVEEYPLPGRRCCPSARRMVAAARDRPGAIRPGQCSFDHLGSDRAHADHPSRPARRTFTLLRMLMQGADPLGGVLDRALSSLLEVFAMILVSAGLVGLPGLVDTRIAAPRKTS